MNQTNLYAEMIFLLSNDDRKLACKSHWNAKLKKRFRSDIYRIRTMVEKMMFPELIGTDPLAGFDFSPYARFPVTPELLQEIPPLEALQYQRREVGMLIWNLANEIERLLLTCKKADREKIAKHFRTMHNLPKCLISCVESFLVPRQFYTSVKNAIRRSFGEECTGAEDALRRIFMP